MSVPRTVGLSDAIAAQMEVSVPEDESLLNSPYVAELSLDRHSPVPLYHQVSAPIADLITRGRLEPGQLLEDEVSLAQRLAISRPTARRALQELVSKGLVTRRRGSGTRVTPSHVRRPLSLTSLNDDLVRAGFTPHTVVLLYETRLATRQDVERLGCSSQTEVVRIERSRSLDDRRLAILTNLIPADIAPSLTDLSSQGLYECWKRIGIRPVTAEQSIGARTALPEDAEALSLPVGAPLLTMEPTSYDSEGRTLEFGSHIYNAGLYSFHLRLFAD